jgi:hypothetical protein
MKYVVDRIEEGLVVLVEEKTRKITIKKYEELPRVVPGDVLYYDPEDKDYIVDEYERAERLKNLRAELNNIWDIEE